MPIRTLVEQDRPAASLRDRELNPLKVLHHFDRLRALADGRDTAPVTVEIDPVAYCNHACGWCVDPVHTHVQLDVRTYEALITELAAFRVDGAGVEGIVFKGGGEPTLHPDFPAMVERAAGLGFAVGVVTNGSRLHGSAETLAARADYVRVSIDGPTPASHRLIHRSRDFERVLDGVRVLVAVRGERHRPVIGLSFAIDIRTLGLAGEAIRLGERLAVDYVLLRPPFFEEVGRAPTMGPEQALQVRSGLRRLAAEYSGPLEVMVGDWIGDAERRGVEEPGLQPSGRRDAQLGDALPIEHRTGRCLASPLLGVVASDGKLYGCCNLRGLPEWAMGRLDHDAGRGFAALWHGEARRAVLERMHHAQCLRHCTHPLSRYNSIIEVLRDRERPHSQFV